VNPNLPLANVRTLEEILAGSLSRTSFTLVMVGIAGGVALLLGMVGIYGVISYAVSQRTREIGVRMALGAQRFDVRRMVVREGLVLTGIGIVLGLSVALALSRMMSSLLFGVGAMDPMTYGAVAVGLGAVAVAASYLPASRASRLDPAVTLRQE
jgi:ABC-type antimicrobial peptide transport system permease subunit